MFEALEELEEVEIMAIDPTLPLSRLTDIEFDVADARKPLASAVKMVRSGNRVALDAEGSLIVNKPPVSAWR